MTLAVSLSILDDCRGAGYSSQLSDCLSVLDFSTCERIAEEAVSLTILYQLLHISIMNMYCSVLLEVETMRYLL